MNKAISIVTIAMLATILGAAGPGAAHLPVDIPPDIESVPTGSLRVNVDLPDVKVYINGELEGLAHPDRPLERQYLPTGETTVKVKAESHPSKDQTVTISAGQLAELHFQLKPHPPHIGKLLEKGDAYFQKQQFTAPAEENAFRMYKSVLETEPENQAARQRIAEILAYFKTRGDQALAEEDYQKAKGFYEQYLSIVAEVPDIFENCPLKPGLSVVQKRMKELQLLLKPTEELLAQADEYFQKERYTTPQSGNAFHFYRLVLTTDPDNPHARKRIYEMMSIYQRRGAELEEKNPKKAREYYDRYLRLAKYAANHLGDKSLTDEIRRLEAQQAALQKRDQRVRELIEQGDEHFIAQRYTRPAQENAFEKYRAALTLDPDNPHAIKQMKKMLGQYRQWGDRAFKKKEHPRAQTFYNQYLMIAEFLTDQLNLPLRSHAIDPVRKRLQGIEDTDKLIKLADICFAQGQFLSPADNNAFALYRKILRIDPGNAHAQKQIQEMMQRLKAKAKAAQNREKYARARTLYEQYLRIAGYAIKILGARHLKPEIQSVRSEIEAINSRIKAF